MILYFLNLNLLPILDLISEILKKLTFGLLNTSRHV